MGYPYGPQGHDPYAGGHAQPGYGDPYAQQGYAYGAPAYGASAYGAQPYPPPAYAHGYAAPGYGQPRAGGGTAITAAVLALLIALVVLIGIGIAAIVILGESTGEEEPMLGVLAFGCIPGSLWLLGSILLFRRKTAGRMLLIVLSSFTILGAGSSIARASSRGFETAPGSLILSVVATFVPLLILICAAAPATGRWIRAARQPAYAPYPY
ncbi:hypothetical protein [Nocardia sp. NPDC050717]|uniref:hypothetical protein n=1 Tax=Nocardia sp. NPDC050717 TaxID=3157221 RepID=UPI0033C78D15